MTTIHIEEKLNLDKTHFKTLKEFQLYIMMQKKDEDHSSSLSQAHKKIIYDRIKEADETNEPGLLWDEIKEDLKREGLTLL